MTRHTTHAVLVVAVCWYGVATAQDVKPTQASLFNECRRIHLRIDAPNYGAEDSARGIAESRLRSAQLYRIPNPNGGRDLLEVGNVLAIELSDYSVRVAFTPSTRAGDDHIRVTTAWEAIVSPAEQRSTLAAIIDHFVQEYLRENESACTP